MVDFSLKNFSFFYPERDQASLDQINLDIHSGELIVLCGRSGSGKSTLLKMLKPELTPKGKMTGEIRIFSKQKSEISQRDSAEKIGFLLQNTEYQTVTHTVRSELAFGLENLGYSREVIRLRMAEICDYFSLEKLLDRKTCELSGGKKQLLCLAAVVAMHPRVLILDEPTAQLDPMTAQTLMETAARLCRENGMTVIICEQRLESVIPVADRVIIMEKGRTLSDTPPRQIPRELFSSNEFVSLAMPSAMRIHARLEQDGPAALHVTEGRRMLERLLGDQVKYTSLPEKAKDRTAPVVLAMKNVSYAYDRSGFVLKNFSLEVRRGEFLALLGANAAGKTTALSLMGGLLKCRSGKISVLGKDIKKYKDSELYGAKIAMLPQNCESLFACNTIGEDLYKVLSGEKMSRREKTVLMEEAASFFEISDLLDRHPYDVSAGEMQRAALAMVMLRKPEILLLDEPTKGMDNLFKASFGQKIRELCDGGVTVIMVSHDAEFCAEYCSECAMVFDGICALKTDVRDFFSRNYFYTTVANKIARDYFPKSVTEEEVIRLCQKNIDG